MSEEPQSVPASVALPVKASAAGNASKVESDDSLLPRVSELLKLASLAYVIGFAVIMEHTARLNAPVVEAFQFQNILAGLPVWLLLCFALWLWPRLIRPVRGDATRRGLNKRGLITFIVALFVGVPLLFWIVRGLAHRSFSISITGVLISGLLFLAVLSMLWAAFKDVRANVEPEKAVLILASVYSGVLFFTLGYARFVYPVLPQSVGGGHPVKVRLYFKDHELATLLGAGSAPGEQTTASQPVYLYYRTSSYLLVSKPKGGTLIQVPAGEVLAVDWLDSQAR